MLEKEATRGFDPDYQRKTSSIRCRLTRGEYGLIHAAAIVSGLSLARFMVGAATSRALEVLIAAQNRSSRARPGAVIWAAREGGQVFEPVQVADGEERLWVVGRADVPPRISASGQAWVVDWAASAKGGRGYLIAIEDLHRIGVDRVAPDVEPDRPKT